MPRKISNQKFIYFNYLKECPNCGAKLKSRDKDCPACGINLVGYNDVKNRANNLTIKANEMQQMVEKHEELNKKIRSHNEGKINGREPLFEITATQLKILLILTIVIIVLSKATSLAINIVDKMKNDYKTYEEVEKYFEEYEPEAFQIDAVEKEYKNVKHEYYFTNDLYVCKAEMYFEPKDKLTTIRELYNSEKETITIDRVFDATILYAPELNVSNDISFDSNLFPIHFNDELMERDIETLDEYALQYFVDDENNLIEKWKTLIIDDLEFETYIIKTTKKDKYNKFIALAKIEDGVFFESTIMVEDEERLEDIKYNLEKYFSMNFKRGDLKNE